MKNEDIAVLNSLETFPSLPHHILAHLVNKTTFTQIKALPRFHYGNQTECSDCDYREPSTDKAGNVYFGQWKNFEKEGRGMVIWANGDVY